MRIFLCTAKCTGTAITVQLQYNVDYFLIEI